MGNLLRRMGNMQECGMFRPENIGLWKVIFSINQSNFYAPLSLISGKGAIFFVQFLLSPIDNIVISVYTVYSVIVKGGA